MTLTSLPSRLIDSPDHSSAKFRLRKSTDLGFAGALGSLATDCSAAPRGPICITPKYDTMS